MYARRFVSKILQLPGFVKRCVGGFKFLMITCSRSSYNVHNVKPDTYIFPFEINNPDYERKPFPTKDDVSTFENKCLSTSLVICIVDKIKCIARLETVSTPF